MASQLPAVANRCVPAIDQMQSVSTWECDGRPIETSQTATCRVRGGPSFHFAPPSLSRGRDFPYERERGDENDITAVLCCQGMLTETTVTKFNTTAGSQVLRHRR
jgi:hypothetical protein